MVNYLKNKGKESSTLEKFLKDNEKHAKLYDEWTKTKDEKLLLQLDVLFKDFLYKACLFSYIYKSLNFKAMEVRRKHSKRIEFEELSLTTFFNDTEEVKERDIPDTPTDLVEEIYGNTEEFWQTISNTKLLQAINNLTERQKLVLYRCIIRNDSERDVAEQLNITVQGVNKIKNTALRKIRKDMGVL